MFKGKKVLLVGLGLLGGGVATAKFLIKNGAKISITDKRSKEILGDSIAKLPKDISYTLGSHKKKDFDKADAIVANQAVSRYGEWVQYAEKQGKRVYSDLTLFLEMFGKKNKDYIAITGTRGKTTTSLWINHFLSGSVLGGNIPEKGLLKILTAKGNPFVLEMSSFQLEYMLPNLLAPKIALITNFYQDHINRHGNMKEYLKAKGLIFLNQTKEDFLILNLQDAHTKEFLKLKPKAKILFFSVKPLPKSKNGIFVSKGKIYTSIGGKKQFVIESPFNTDFENQNLMGSMLASYIYKTNNKRLITNNNTVWKDIIRKIKSLPQAPMRREVIIKKKGLVVVNDSSGTSPDATIALLSSYEKTPKVQKILITGGTDKQLDFKEWAKLISKTISSDNLYLLNGSSTQKMIAELNHLKYWKKMDTVKIFETLSDIVRLVSVQKGNKTILFSPSSASFEKFKNEFDRGRQFNRLAQKYF
jgi:UDP-N-acetylmuramoylalanine--D-glutamate ligase